MARRLIHEKRFKRVSFADGFFHGPALVVEFAAKARSAAVLLACKLAFHAPLISNEKALATLNIQVNAPIAVVEMGAPVQDAVSQQIQRHGVSERCPKRFNNVKGKRCTSVRRFVKKSNRRVKSDGVEASFRLGAQQGVSIGEDRIGRIVWRPP
jgi:hypothetical protein